MAAYDDESNEGLLTEELSGWKTNEFQHQIRHMRAIIIPWVLAIFFFCTTCLFAWQSRTSPMFEIPGEFRNNGTYETGYSTDFVSESPRIDIQIIQKHFTNDLRFNSTSQGLYNEHLATSEITYIGPPSDEIDAAWHALLHDQYVSITAEEAQQFPEQDRALIFYDHDRHYYFELSVFHNLHCLDEIRKTLDPDYYDAKTPHGQADPLAGRVHIDHCVDQIRQALQCHADLTPVPMVPVVGWAGAALGNGLVHTCRDFDRIREWVHQRGVQAKALGD